MLHIAICEDDPSDVSAVLALIESYGKTRDIPIGTASFSSSEALLAHLHLKEAARYEIYILDIYLEGRSGIALAHSLRERDRHCAIFFLTCSPDHALEAFQVKAAHYLLKPVEPEIFFSALDRCYESICAHRDTEPRMIVVRAQDAVEHLPTGKILYVESLGKRQKIFLTDRAIIAKSTLQAIADDLLSDRHFFVPHRAFVVNVRHVRRVATDRVIMTNDEEIFLARRKYREVKKIFLDYALRSA